MSATRIERLRGMLAMAVASDDAFNRLSPAGFRLLEEVVGALESNALGAEEASADLQACWDALQAETLRADAVKAEPVAYAKPQSAAWTMGQQFVWAADRTEAWMRETYTVPLYAAPTIAEPNGGQSDGYAPGDPPPYGYMQWHAWAKVQHDAGLHQRRCSTCGHWKFPQEFSADGKSLIACRACAGEAA